MLDHQLKSRKMAKLDRIDWGEFKAYLNKNEQWLAKKDISVYMSSLIAFSSSQLEALADAEGMTGTASSSKRTATAAFADPNDNSKRQRFEQWGAQVAASINGDSANPQGPTSPCLFCGRHHSLAQCRGVLKLIEEHKRYQLAKRGGISKPSLHRGSSWRTKKPAQFGARAYSGGGNGAADRGKLSYPPGYEQYRSKYRSRHKTSRSRTSGSYLLQAHASTRNRWYYSTKVETPETNYVPSLYHRQSSACQSTCSIYSCRSTDRTVARCLHRSIRQRTHR
jgi:hypothetical protein